MQAIKGKTSYALLRDFRTIRRKFWGRHFWARGYFVASSGQITDEVIAKYFEEQDAEREDDDFKVTE
jgi:putative transposase